MILGGKKVNRGIATVVQGMKGGSIILEFEFPCASTISVIVYTNINSTLLGIEQGNNYTNGDFLDSLCHFLFLHKKMILTYMK